MCEERLGAVSSRELARELLEQREDFVARGVVTVEGMGNWARHQRSEEMIDAFGVQERGELGENIRCGDAQRHHRERHGGSGGVWASDVGGGKEGEIGAVRREDDVVDGEEGHATFGLSGNMAGIHREHVGGHIGGEIVDDYVEFRRENVRAGLGFDTREDFKHARVIKSVSEILLLRSDLTYSGPRHCRPSRM